jgi:hypothetical protein
MMINDYVAMFDDIMDYVAMFDDIMDYIAMFRGYLILPNIV